MVHLKIKAMSEEVAAMYRSHGHYHKGDSGLDLFITKEQVIRAGETAVINLGIKASAWTEEEGGKAANVSWLLMPRSSISKTPLRLCNSVGLIDAGYRGEVMAAVDNIKKEDYTLNKADRIVQAVAFGGESLSFELVETLDETSRGEGGFGSTIEEAETTTAPQSSRTEHDDMIGNGKSKISCCTTGEESETKKLKIADGTTELLTSIDNVGSSSS